MSNNKFVYFIFSSSQYRMKQDTMKTIGKEYNPGTVLVNGVYKQFTDIVDEVDSTRYPDAIVITSGYLDSIKYKRR